MGFKGLELSKLRIRRANLVRLRENEINTCETSTNSKQRQRANETISSLTDRILEIDDVIDSMNKGCKKS